MDNNKFSRLMITDLNGQQAHAYICPNCYRVTKIYTQDIRDMYIISDDDSISIDTITAKFNVCCSNCDEYMFECDGMLVNRIISLNKLGFRTENCCEGHVREIMYPFNRENDGIFISIPYIQFMDHPCREDVDFIEGLINNPKYSGVIHLEYDANHWTLNALYSNKYLYTEDSRCAYKKYVAKVKGDFLSTKCLFLTFIDEFIAHYSKK